jgi:hypothetical protein
MRVPWTVVPLQCKSFVILCRFEGNHLSGKDPLCNLLQNQIVLKFLKLNQSQE